MSTLCPILEAAAVGFGLSVLTYAFVNWEMTQLSLKETKL